MHVKRNYDINRFCIGMLLPLRTISCATWIDFGFQCKMRTENVKSIAMRANTFIGGGGGGGDVQREKWTTLSDRCKPKVSVNPIQVDIVQDPVLFFGFVWFVPLPLNYLYYGLDIRLDLQLMLFAMQPNPQANIFHFHSTASVRWHGKPKPEQKSIPSSLLILTLLIFIEIKWKAIKMFHIQFSRVKQILSGCLSLSHYCDMQIVTQSNPIHVIGEEIRRTNLPMQCLSIGFKLK